MQCFSHYDCTYIHFATDHDNYIAQLNDYFTDLALERIFVDIPFQFNEYSPQFTVTCITTGGPVGCVLWRRDSTYITNPNATSTLVDPLNSRYIHVLTVTGSLPSVYRCRCRVSNNNRYFEYSTTVYSKSLDISLYIDVGAEFLTIIVISNIQPQYTVSH